MEIVNSSIDGIGAALQNEVTKCIQKIYEVFRLINQTSHLSQQVTIIRVLRFDH